MVSPENGCVRGIVENVRVLSAASFFLGAALGIAQTIFNLMFSNLLISLRNATSFLVDGHRHYKQTLKNYKKLIFKKINIFVLFFVRIFECYHIS